jgi:hypothetical protein
MVKVLLERCHRRKDAMHQLGITRLSDFSRRLTSARNRQKYRLVEIIGHMHAIVSEMCPKAATPQVAMIFECAKRNSMALFVNRWIWSILFYCG